MEVITERWTEIKDYTSVSEEMFLEPLKFCLTKGYCKFNNVSYGQVEGIAMSSPLSPIVAEF
jgi:hypothetical protein